MRRCDPQLDLSLIDACRLPRGSLSVGALQPPFQLRPEDPVLLGELVALEPFLLDLIYHLVKLLGMRLPQLSQVGKDLVNFLAASGRLLALTFAIASDVASRLSSARTYLSSVLRRALVSSLSSSNSVLFFHALDHLPPRVVIRGFADHFALPSMIMLHPPAALVLAQDQASYARREPPASCVKDMKTGRGVLSRGLVGGQVTLLNVLETTSHNLERLDHGARALHDLAPAPDFLADGVFGSDSTNGWRGPC